MVNVSRMLDFLLQNDNKNLKRLGEALRRAPFVPNSDKPDRYYDIIDHFIRCVVDTAT